MKLNVHIIADELKISQENILTENNYELDLSGFELADFKSGKAMSRKLLYVAEAAKVAAHVDILSGQNILIVGQIEASFTKALKNQFCNVLIVENLASDKVANLLQNIFNGYSLWNERLLEACLVHQTLERIFNIIIEVIKNPLLLLDSSFNLVLTAGKVPEVIDNTYWKFFLPHGYSSFEKLGDLSKPLQYEKHIDSQKPRWIKSVKAEYHFMSVNLNLQGKSLGEITIVETYEPLTLGQLSLLNHIRKSIEAEIRATSENATKTQNSTYVFQQLIRGAYVDDGLVASQLKKHKWQMEDRYYVLCLMKDEKAVSQGIIDFYKTQLHQYFINGIILVYGQYIIILLKEDCYPYFNDHNYIDFKATLANLNMKCGISQVFNNIKDLYIYFRQSRVAANYGKKINPDSNLYYFRAYFLDYLVTELKITPRKNIICDPRVLVLKKHDESSSTKLVNTLFYYLKCGSNLRKTADLLFVHRNTLSHRLHQIKDLAGINLESGEPIDQLLVSCILVIKNKLSDL